jgi:hypothetical protein
MKESEVFSIIADETKDLQKKEQLSLVLWYYYNGAVPRTVVPIVLRVDINSAVGRVLIKAHGRLGHV